MQNVLAADYRRLFFINNLLSHILIYMSICLYTTILCYVIYAYFCGKTLYCLGVPGCGYCSLKNKVISMKCYFSFKQFQEMLLKQ